MSSAANSLSSPDPPVSSRSLAALLWGPSSPPFVPPSGPAAFPCPASRPFPALCLPLCHPGMNGLSLGADLTSAAYPVVGDTCGGLG